MKKLIALLFLLVTLASAQNYSTVSGTAVLDKNGVAVTGTIEFVPDREFGFVGGSMACCNKSVQIKATVTAGSFSGLLVPRKDRVNPAGVCFTVYIKDTTGKIVQGPDGYRCVQPTGASYDFGTYTPLIAAVPNTPQAVFQQDCSLLGAGYVLQTINPDGTSKCVLGSGSGVADPGSNGLVKRTALNVLAHAAASDVVAAFTGTPNGSQFMRDDGALATPAGASFPLTSPTANPASAGSLRLANNTDKIEWNNAAGNANLAIYFDSSNVFQIPGTLNVGSLTTGGTGPDTYTGNNDPACSNTFLIWASLTTANTFKYCDANSNIRIFANQSGTSGGIPYYSSATTQGTSAALTSNVLIKGGGAGAAPAVSSITDNGSLVSTAEDVAVSTLSTGGTTKLLYCAGAGATCFGGTEGTKVTTDVTAGTFKQIVDSTQHELYLATNATNTYGLMVRSEPGATSQKAESGADTNVLTFTPASVVASYRISFVMDVSAATAATLGWTATWTDSNAHAQAPTNLSLFTEGTAAPALTVSGAANATYHGEAIVNVSNAGTNIVVKLTFSGTSFAAKVSATIERIL